MGFNIGIGSTINLGCTFDSAKNLEIGTNTIINENCRLDTRGSIRIGNNVSVSAEVTILTADHDMNDNMRGRQSPVVIHDYCWIGTQALILPGIELRKGVVVAAGSVVTRSVEMRDVVAGVPAKTLKKREESFNYNASYIRLFK